MSAYRPPERLESSYERSFVRSLAGLGLKALKLKDLAGYPDRIIPMPGGRTIFCELKRPDEDLRRLQQQRRKELEQLGYVVLVIYDDETKLAAVSFIKKLLDEHDRSLTR